MQFMGVLGGLILGAITVIKNPIVMKYRNEQHSSKKKYTFLLAVLFLTETRKELELSFIISFMRKYPSIARGYSTWVNSGSQVN